MSPELVVVSVALAAPPRFTPVVPSTVATVRLPASRVNCSVPVRYTRTLTSDHIVIARAGFTSGQIPGDTGTSEISIDYLQDQALQTYSYTVTGNATSGALGGQIQFIFVGGT